MRRDGHPSEADLLRRSQRLDDLLAAPHELPAGLEERLLRVPDTTRPPARAWIAAVAASLLLLAGVLALRSRETESERSSAREQTVAHTPVVPSRRARILDVLRRPTDANRAFLRTEGDRALVTLHRVARGRDTEDATAAIEHLGVLARPASLPVLVGALRRADRREPAIRALGALGDGSAAGPVAPYLADPDLFEAARDALVRVGGVDAVAALVAVLDEVEEPAALVAAIASIGDEAAAHALVRLLERPAFEDAALAALAEAKYRPALLDAARGRDAALALDAISALERLAPPEAVPALRALLADATRRGPAARALAAIDTPEAGAALLDAHGARGVREAFGRAGPGIEAGLLARLEDGDRRERRRVVGLLALCGSERSVPALLALASDRALAPEVLETLGRIGGARAVAALEELAAHSALKRPAIEALAVTRSVDAVPALVRLGTSDRQLRGPAIAALGRIPHAAAVRAILTLDGSRRTRRTTSHVLLAMDRSTVVPVLVALLEGDDAAEAAEARRWLDAVHP